MTSGRSISPPGVGSSGDTSFEIAYASQFSKHLDHVRSHLSGKDRSGRLPSSFFPPGAYWTSTEKDLFFHALAIHSRLRPDLIAKEVKTKSVVDVCLYVQLLESSTHTDGPMLRKDFQIATGVSDAFVDLEEQIAASILAAEPQWERRALEEGRKAEVHTREKAMRARKGEAQSETNEHYREDVKRRKKEFQHWLNARKEEWQVEDTLQTLNFATLEAMDRILREEDEASLQVEDEAEAVRDNANHVERETQLDVREENAVVTDRVAHNEAEMAVTTSIDETMIDPSLRTQSQDPGLAIHEKDAAPSTPNHRTSLSPTAPAHTLPSHQFRPRTPPFRYTSLSPSPGRPLSRASSVASGSRAESGLTAAARRKLQKRLHMRKKRAEARGGSVVSTASRLKPGRKRTEKALKGSTAYTKPASRNAERTPTSDGTVSPAEKAVSEEPGARNDSTPPGPSQDGRTRHSHLSGTTLPYKLLRKLREIGLDADKLQEECVGVLSLKGVARLMRLYNRLHDVDPTVSSQISSDATRLLNAHVLYFTVEVMHHVIVLREQERESKRHTKGWRLGKFDHISHVHVEQALSLIGCTTVTKKEHFEGLLERLGLREDDFEDEAAEPSEVGGESSEEEADDEREVNRGEQAGSEDEDEASFDPLKFPLHRAVVPPVIYFSPAESSPSMSGAPRSLAVSLYMPWPAPSASAEPPLEEDLMSEETDTDALVEELLDEEQLDEHDQTMEEAYEESLWTESGAPPPPEAQPRPRRKRKRIADEDGEDEP